MADTRCVNPANQLDVDVLILEYLLYNALRAEFSVLRPGCEVKSEEDTINSLPSSDVAEANRLLQAFDCKSGSQAQITALRRY